MPGDVPGWLTLARGGSREALGAALEACRHYLLAVAGRQLDTDVQAKGGASDLVQQTFLEAQRDFDGFHGSTEAELLAWLRHVLLHNVGKLHRRYRTGKRDAGREIALTGEDSSANGIELSAGLSTPSGRAAANEEAVLLEQALTRLPEEYRRVIELRHGEQYSFAEIGKLLNRSSNAARMLWVRAVERLRQELPEDHEH